MNLSIIREEEEGEIDGTLPTVELDENALSFLTKNRLSPLFSFFDISPLETENVFIKGFCPGDAIEVFYDDFCHGCFFLYKLLISFILPSYIVNKDSETSNRVPFVNFKKFDSREDDVKVLFFANSRYFRYQQFLDIFETTISLKIQEEITIPQNRSQEQSSEELIFRVFGGEPTYRKFVVQCLSKVYFMFCDNAFDFRCKMDLIHLKWDSTSQYQVIMIDNIQAFRTQNLIYGGNHDELEDEELLEVPSNMNWMKAMKKLRDLIEKKSVSAVLGRNQTRTYKQEKVPAFLKLSDYLNKYYDKDKVSGYYSKYWKNYKKLGVLNYKLALIKNKFIMKWTNDNGGSQTEMSAMYDFALDRSRKTLVFLGVRGRNL